MENYGYRKLIVWQNAYKLRRLVYETTKRFSYIDGLINKVEFNILSELCGKTEYLFMRLIQSLQKKKNLM